MRFALKIVKHTPNEQKKSKGRKLSEIIGILPNILKCIVNAKTLLCSCFILVFLRCTKKKYCTEIANLREILQQHRIIWDKLISI
ncbi:hypothetical protein V1478_006433 [Vespula squamosa]|uniref:Uncharacterized protein n=1 Tax=Vespula squamosa TaxID=30214 RepID=A0ABD2B7T9_VESSQ